MKTPFLDQKFGVVSTLLAVRTMNLQNLLYRRTPRYCPTKSAFGTVSNNDRYRCSVPRGSRGLASVLSLEAARGGGYCCGSSSGSSSSSNVSGKACGEVSRRRHHRHYNPSAVVGNQNHTGHRLPPGSRCRLFGSFAGPFEKGEGPCGDTDGVACQPNRSKPTQSVPKRTGGSSLSAAAAAAAADGGGNGGDNATTVTSASKTIPSPSPRQRILHRFDHADDPSSLSSCSSVHSPSEAAAAARAAIERKAAIDTLDWLEGVVIGYNFCPFAEAPMLRDELAIKVVLGSDATTVLAVVLEESLRLAGKGPGRRTTTTPAGAAGAATGGTSLVVCPDLCPGNFLAFLEFQNILVEGILPDHGLSEIIQVVPFHPLFVFGDGDGSGGDNHETEVATNSGDSDAIVDGDCSDADDPIENYTNRSPYPIFHVLREAEVEKAVDALGGNAETVWKRNVDVLRAMEELFLEAERGGAASGDDCDAQESPPEPLGTTLPATESQQRQRQQQQMPTATLTPSRMLRSVFLRGKADHRSSSSKETHRYKERQEESSCPPSSVLGSEPLAAEVAPGGGCPLTKKAGDISGTHPSTTVATTKSAAIERYKKQIRLVLKEFRKKDY